MLSDDGAAKAVLNCSGLLRFLRRPLIRACVCRIGNEKKKKFKCLKIIKIIILLSVLKIVLSILFPFGFNIFRKISSSCFVHFKFDTSRTFAAGLLI